MLSHKNHLIKGAGGQRRSHGGRNELPRGVRRDTPAGRPIGSVPPTQAGKLGRSGPMFSEGNTNLVALCISVVDCGGV